MYRVATLLCLCILYVSSVCGVTLSRPGANERSTELSSEEDALQPENTPGIEMTSARPNNLECKIGKKVFVVNTAEKLTWFRAYLYCYGKDIDMAVISNADEYGMLVNAIKQSEGVTSLKPADDVAVWTSGYFDPDEEEYRWITRLTPMNFTVWREGRPDPRDNLHKCVELRKSMEYKMNDVFCMDENFVACQKLEYSWGPCSESQ